LARRERGPARGVYSGPVPAGEAFPQRPATAGTGGPAARVAGETFTGLGSRAATRTWKGNIPAGFYRRSRNRCGSAPGGGRGVVPPDPVEAFAGAGLSRQPARPRGNPDCSVVAAAGPAAVATLTRKQSEGWRGRGLGCLSPCPRATRFGPGQQP